MCHDKLSCHCHAIDVLISQVQISLHSNRLCKQECSSRQEESVQSVQLFRTMQIPSEACDITTPEKYNAHDARSVAPDVQRM